MAGRRLFFLLFFGFLLGGGGGVGAAPPDLYDESLQARALEALRRGDLQEALDGFCAMLRPAAGGEIWTIAVHLICEEENLAQAVDQIPGPAPVFIMSKEFEGRICYRVCAGLSADSREIIQWRIRLPEELQHAGPFPVRIDPCTVPPPRKTDREGAAVHGVSEEAEPQAAAYVEVELIPVEAGPSPAPDSLPTVSAPSQAAGSAGGPVRGGAYSSGLFESPKIRYLAGGAAPPDPLLRTRSEGEAWFQKGLSAYARGDRGEARRCYEESLRLQPDKPEALNNLGVLYLEEGRFQEARVRFEAAVAAAPNYARAHLNLAGALWGLEERETAVEAAQEAVRLDNHDINAHLTLASFLRSLGREEEALAEARMVLILQPDNAPAREFIESPPKEKGLLNKMKGWFRRDGEASSD